MTTADARAVAIESTTLAELAARSGFNAETVAAGNVLGNPAYVRQISGLHHAKLERVAIELPKDDRSDSTDLYRMQGKLAPTKRLLERIALAGGLKWDAERCRIDYVDASNVVYTAVGGIRGPGGEMVWMPKSKEWLLEAELIDIHERAATLTKWQSGTKREATQPERESYIRTETARTKANRLANVESKAKNRVIRSLLGVPGAADRAYWSKPLYVLRIDMVLDASDPMTKGMLLAEAIGARGLLGMRTDADPAPPQLAAAPEPEAVDEQVDATTVEVVDETPASPPATAACGSCRGEGTLPAADGTRVLCPTCQGNGLAA